MTEVNKKSKNVVAVFAHPDDEASVIGTLANHSEKGDNVFVIFLTRGENASSIGGSPEEIMKKREGHAKSIEKILGAEYRLMDLPDSGVHPSVENAKKLAKHFKDIKPDIIITWSQSDQIGLGHPDHRYTYDIVIDAISYMRYKDPNCEFEPHRASISFFTTFFQYSQNSGDPYFIDVSNQMEKIMAVLGVYKEAYGNWPVEKYIEAMLTMFGRMAGVRYAEAFHKVLWGTAKSYLY